MDAELEAAAEAVLDLCRRNGLRAATAESCTGGLIAGALTAIAGSSDVVEGGFVTYSNSAKTMLLGVSAEAIERLGAVSAEVAEQMAAGTLVRLPGAGLAVSATGIAGPGGGSDAKPVGLVYMGIASRGQPPRSIREVFPGSRSEVRRATVLSALRLLLEEARSSQPR